MQILDNGLQQSVGFIELKELKVEKQLTPEEILALRSAAKLASSLPEITSEIKGMDDTVINRAFGDIRKGTLTPERSMAYLMELYSNNRLLKRMEHSAAAAANITETRSDG